ncbi:MAG: hypothetical protein A3E83_06415 [Gammaproteobacteria bacterium RIFCSPHIGHO2_12_FULL_41_20]|nr:MAG: hypothetical protein A3E83_06415 [Gammaproteobacteria bacterium RIFCSPHIGHO2_12_FULL_41_20]
MDSQLKRSLSDTCIFSGVFFLLALISLFLSQTPGVITSLWVSNVVGIVLLLRHHIRNWSIPLLGISISNFLAYIVFRNDLSVSSYFTVINIAEILFTSWILIRYHIFTNFDQEAKSAIILFFTATLVSPLLNGILHVIFFGLYLDNFLHWFISDGICMISLLPLALGLLRKLWHPLTAQKCTVFFLLPLLTSGVAILELLFFPYVFIVIVIPLLFIAIFSSFFTTIITASINVFVIFTVYNAGIFVPLLSADLTRSHYVYMPTVLIFFLPYLLSIFITQRKKLELENKTLTNALYDEKEHFKILLNSIADSVIAVNAKGLITFMNPEAQKLTGWSFNKAKGLASEKVFSIVNKQTNQALKPLALCLADKQIRPAIQDVLLINKNGEKYDIRYSTSLLKYKDNTIIGAELVLQNITQEKFLQQELNYHATHDALTGLLNRREFEKALNNILQELQLQKTQHILCYIDLDNFKIINDSAGHPAGDALLQEIASLIHKHIRKIDVLARLGGDEFGLILTNCSLSAGKKICQELINLINAIRFLWENKVYKIGVSIGMLAIVDKTLSTNQLLSEADVACYAAKTEGRNRIFIYQAEKTESIEHHHEILMASTLQEAIEKNRIVLYAQKIISTNPKKIHSHFEILIRMLDTNNQLIQAADFIPIAERFNLMGDIDHWVLTELLEKHGEKLSKLNNTIFSINISANSLNNPAFLTFLLPLIKNSLMRPENLCFEITETATMNQISKTITIINELQRIGCKVAIDDFGVGLSSFSYIKHFPVNYIKIDGSFFKNIAKHTIDEPIVRAMNDMAHHLGIATMAEFVENAAILKITSQIGIDYAQGYAIGKPQPLASIIDGL